MYSVQELHLCLFSFLDEVVSTSFVSSLFSVHSSANLSANLFLHSRNFKYSHSRSQLLGFQINPLSYTSLSINSQHSHLHLSSFQRCLSLQTLLLNLHLFLHVSCHCMCLVSLVADTRLNTLTFKFFATSGRHNFASGLLIFLQLPLYLLVLML